MRKSACGKSPPGSPARCGFMPSRFRRSLVYLDVCIHLSIRTEDEGRDGVANTGQADAQPIQSPVFSSIGIDSSLVAAAQRDRTAFAPLYQRYVDPIHRYCLRRLGSIEAAEDATAQIFTKALAALPAYREQGISFRSWLFTIAHNILVDIERGFRLHQGL